MSTSPVQVTTYGKAIKVTVDGPREPRSKNSEYIFEGQRIITKLTFGLDGNFTSGIPPLIDRVSIGTRSLLITFFTQWTKCIWFGLGKKRLFIHSPKRWAKTRHREWSRRMLWSRAVKWIKFIKIIIGTVIIIISTFLYSPHDTVNFLCQVKQSMGNEGVLLVIVLTRSDQLFNKNQEN